MNSKSATYTRLAPDYFGSAHEKRRATTFTSSISRSVSEVFLFLSVLPLMDVENVRPLTEVFSYHWCLPLSSLFLLLTSPEPPQERPGCRVARLWREN